MCVVSSWDQKFQQHVAGQRVGWRMQTFCRKGKLRFAGFECVDGGAFDSSPVRMTEQFNEMLAVLLVDVDEVGVNIFHADAVGLQRSIEADGDESRQIINEAINVETAAHATNKLKIGKATDPDGLNAEFFPTIIVNEEYVGALVDALRRSRWPSNFSFAGWHATRLIGSPKKPRVLEH